MPLPVSVVIAALDEESRIAASVQSAFASGAAEVIVADGGSSDATPRIAGEHGARVVSCPPMRSRQLNLGADAAQNDALCFLHADTTLPAGGAAAILQALQRFEFGGFRLRFAEPAARLRLAAGLINLRTALTRCPWGDQAQFIRKPTFLDAGRFREIPLMEDYELSLRMKRRGRSVVLPLYVTTSGRRFLARGVAKTALRNWEIVVRWRLGADPGELARRYRA